MGVPNLDLLGLTVSRHHIVDNKVDLPTGITSKGIKAKLIRLKDFKGKLIKAVKQDVVLQAVTVLLADKLVLGKQVTGRVTQLVMPQVTALKQAFKVFVDLTAVRALTARLDMANKRQL